MAVDYVYMNHLLINKTNKPSQAHIRLARLHHNVACLSSLSRRAVSFICVAVGVCFVSPNLLQTPAAKAGRNWLRQAVYGCLGALLVPDLVILAADGAGTVEFATGRPIDVSADDVVRVVVADIDGDGDSDIVAAMFAGGKVLWYDNLDSKGTFAEGNEITKLERPT